jgi:hypothetical protein
LIALVSPIASLIIYGVLALFYALSSSFFGRDETASTVARTASAGEPPS